MGGISKKKYSRKTPREREKGDKYYSYHSGRNVSGRTRRKKKNVTAGLRGPALLIFLRGFCEKKFLLSFLLFFYIKFPAESNPVGKIVLNIEEKLEKWKNAKYRFFHLAQILRKDSKLHVHQVMGSLVCRKFQRKWREEKWRPDAELPPADTTAA